MRSFLITLCTLAALASGMNEADARDSIRPTGVGAGQWDQCRYEDGSSQRRCVWDVRHSGNGLGDLSVKIVRGGTDRARYIEITHRRAHTLIHG